MNPCETSAAITALACCIFNSFTLDEAAVLAADFVQLGDTLAAMVARAAFCEARQQKCCPSTDTL